MKKRSAMFGLGSTLAMGMIALSALLTGCSDNSTDPTPSDSNPPGSNATVQVSDPVPADEAASVRTNVQKTSQDTIVITVQQAASTAATTQPGAQVLGVNLDFDRNDLAYECLLRKNGRIILVVVDPKSGAVKSQTDVANAYYTSILVISPTFIHVKDAKQRATQVVGNSVVVENNLEQVDNRPTYVIVLLDNSNRYVTVYVDAETGRERKISDNDECEGEGSGDTHKKHKGRGHYRHGKGNGYGHHFHCLFDNDSTGGNGGGGNGGGQQLPNGVITIDSAKTIVRAMNVDSAGTDTVRFIKTSIDIESDTKVYYEFTYAKKDSNTYVVRLDAFTGAVVEFRQKSGDFTTGDLQPVIKGQTVVALAVARTAALAAYPGTVTEWRLSQEDGKWTYTFDVTSSVTAGEKKQVLIDATTGTLIRVK